MRIRSRRIIFCSVWLTRVGTQLARVALRSAGLCWASSWPSWMSWRPTVRQGFTWKRRAISSSLVRWHAVLCLGLPSPIGTWRALTMCRLWFDWSSMRMRATRHVTSWFSAIMRLSLLSRFMSYWRIRSIQWLVPGKRFRSIYWIKLKVCQINRFCYHRFVCVKSLGYALNEQVYFELLRFKGN